MITKPVPVRVMLLLVFALFVNPSTRAAVTFTDSPPVISNTFYGSVTLAITGLTNGETVVFDNYADLNANGVIDAGDLLLDNFQLVDGRAAIVGGATNINVTADTTGADGSIVAPLHYLLNDVHQAVGSYLYRISSPTARFTSLTNSFVVTNSPFAQSITGTVICDATNVPNVFVVVLDGVVQSVVGGVMADNAGAFTLQLPPGDYVMIPTKPGFVADAGNAPLISLAVNSVATTNLFLYPATNVLAGRVVDAADTNAGVGGIFVVLQSSNGLLTPVATDVNGNFSAYVTADLWQPDQPGFSLAAHGLVEPKNESLPTFDTTTGSVFNAEVHVTRGTALFYGTIKSEAGAPLADVQAGGFHQTQPFNTDGWSDASGNYALATTAGNWGISIAEENVALPYGNLVFTGGRSSSVIASNQAVRIDFTGHPPTFVALTGASKSSPGVFSFTVNAAIGSNIVVEVSTNLASTNWNQFATFSPWDYFGVEMNDTNATAPRRFYRARREP